MRLYSVLFFITFLLSLFFVAAVNFEVDVAGVYWGRPENAPLVRSYVTRLMESKAGLVFVAVERTIKLELAKRTDAECIVVGSSHEMQLSKTSAPQIFSNCRSVANLAVSGGTFEDFVAAVGALERRRFTGTVFVGVSPWMFRTAADGRYAEQWNIYDEGRRTFGLSRQALSFDEESIYYANLLSWDYLKTNLIAVVRTMDVAAVRARRFQIKDARFAADDEGTITPDGTFEYARSYLRKIANQEPAGDGSYKIQEPTFEPAIVAQFEKVLGVLRNDHVTVKFVLMPYAPSVMNCKGSRGASVCSAFEKVDAYVHRTARYCGCEVIGSYDARFFGLTESDYMDDMHAKQESLWKIRALGTQEGAPLGAAASQVNVGQ